MKREREEFLKNLVNATGPSGYEEDTVRIWREKAKEYTDDVRSDLHGNSIAVLNEGKRPKIMLAGHIDEIGLQITYIDDKGYLHFAPIGGWDPQIIQGQRVVIKGKKGTIKGVVGKKPIHLLRGAEREKVVDIDQMHIDIGVSSKKEAEEIVDVGAPAVIDYYYERLQKEVAIARGFDNRSGAFIVLETLGELAKEAKSLNVSLYAVATVQEEVGLRGAKTSAFRIAPDIGIAVDVTFATDFPGMDKNKFGDIRVGGGPVIARGPNINPKVFELLVKTAEEEKIPYQIEAIPRGTGTDANAIQLTREGVATGLVSIPNRYMHTPCELVNLDDLDNIIKLLSAFIRRVKSVEDFIPFK